ncbi:MAG: hypothetical protein IID36_13030, partial [Planctomycetes bacterium]|nr:hypothetical protein [Planctomycetota bacterium]
SVSAHPRDLDNPSPREAANLRPVRGDTDGGAAGVPLFTLECATVSAGSGVTDNGSILNVGQSVVGLMVGDNFTIEAGIVGCLAETVLEDAPAVPGLLAVGSRYLAVTPAAGDAPVALRVTSDDEACIELYVQTPTTINGKTIGRLAAEPVFLTPAEWGTVAVSDEEVIPDTAYMIAAEGEGGTLSEVAVATTWLWADVNNTRGNVDFDDVLCVLDGFADAYFGACSFFGSDIEGVVTNVTVDFDDILSTLDAFAGADYFANPTHVDPCP